MIDVSQIAKLYIDGDGVRLLYINGNKVWEKPTVVLNGLAFTAQQANSTIKLTAVGTPDAISLEYSTDNGSTYSTYTVGDTITLSSVGKKVLFRAGSSGNSTIGKDSSNYYKFVMTGLVDVYGDVGYLFDQSGSSYAQGLDGLFRGNKNIRNVSFIGQTTFGNVSNDMFNQSSVVNLDLSNIISMQGWWCFSNLCRYCYSLQSADLSNLTSITPRGLNNAFQQCTSLKTLKLSKVSSSGTGSFSNLANGCTALEVVDFSQATAVPTLDMTTAFSNTNDTYKIVVPDSLYSTWIAATNWSSISSHIIKKSDYDAL